MEQIINLSGELQQLPTSYQTRQTIFHQQLLKSSLFSAQIEGNNLTLVEAKNIDLQNPKQKSQLEISNVVKALTQINQLPKQITLSDLKKIHQQVLTGLNADAGKFRTESTGIFDNFGNLVYLTPELPAMEKMLEVWLEHMNLDLDPAAELQNAAACHYYFEKIHPFIDGNGRVGRAMMHYQLQKTNLLAEYILPLDQYFANHRQDYYLLLEKNTTNIAEFIEFFLEGMQWSLGKMIDEISSKDRKQTSPVESLLPRRQEIYYIVQDHPHISLDQIARRFPTMPRRTMANDVKVLVDKQLVIRHGTTRGARYSMANRSTWS